ncbi:MAG: hypothetical protein BGO33_02475 [Bacteroidia bacterium 43-41]|nr:MAG: hypothetical protein BGO33_02475 [Bacteroidia bacterium 43-41]
MLINVKALFLRVKTKVMEVSIIDRFHKNGGYLTRKDRDLMKLMCYAKDMRIGNIMQTYNNTAMTRER